jgi:choline dehydrogenase
MSMAPSQLGAFARSDAAQPHANLQYHVQPLSLRAYDEPIDRFAAFTASVCNLNPTSRGTVTLRSARIQDPPRIAPNYLSTDEDRRVAAESLRSRGASSRSRRCASIRREHLPGAQFSSDEELVREGGESPTPFFTRWDRAHGRARTIRSRRRQPPARAWRAGCAWSTPA